MNTGVIGLGEVGAGVALCLARAGLLASVYDVRPDAATGLDGVPGNAASPAEVARGCEVIVIAVVSAPQTIDVLDGPEGNLATALSGSVIILSFDRLDSGSRSDSQYDRPGQCRFDR